VDTVPRHQVAHHGAAPRGLETTRAAGTARFGALFPKRGACEAGTDAIESLVAIMRHRSEGGISQNDRVAAGFTYLGQFIDHDLTFDPTPFTDRRRDPHALVDFRTPRFDLDSVYGLGPEVQPYLYDRDADPPGVRLLVGGNPIDGTPDLPRNDQGLALIGDPRNDENVIVSQLHLLFVRFHNAVVDHLTPGTPPEKRFEAARRMVRRHYQWIVAHEFLPKVVGNKLARDVLAKRRFFKPAGKPFMPVEFSGAAYRFGHSMVRAGYGLKRHSPGVDPLPALPFDELFGREALSRDHAIDWERFFDLRAPEEIKADPALPAGVQKSLTIDTTLSEPMFRLRPDGRDPMLARRNLLRGHKLGLPSGQSLAAAVGEKALDPTELRIDPGVAHRDVLLRSTPPWYYVLAEAEHRAAGRHLGPVGGRIVGEVLAGLLAADRGSYLHADPPWTPGELGTGDEFTMATLIEFAQPPRQ
jgi:hypothetical protein